MTAHIDQELARLAAHGSARSHAVGLGLTFYVNGDQMVILHGGLRDGRWPSDGVTTHRQATPEEKAMWERLVRETRR